MPSEVTDIKQFLEIARRKDAKGALRPLLLRFFAPLQIDLCWPNAALVRPQVSGPMLISLMPSGARLKKSNKSKDIKLKLRGKRFLYTLILKDSDKADKIKQSLPPTMDFQEIGKKNKKPKKN
ncbi:hypothetical protein G647_01731 [Cladophialophora carrionii CBS 160.54]|uniref:Ribosomal protein L38e n=1 Tax=Cladophialophora carrionii CBS 160.54 TaxID=1279043 RepID=V9DSG6_9EURO|nr:uncharacterized protein G647_01731 [Cladophialophora carrionii CBS 160.54]ETI29278.1 hypothetical protein G647_01731 [Cladophialophora carrionii CBS 160.54]